MVLIVEEFQVVCAFVPPIDLSVGPGSQVWTRQIEITLEARLGRPVGLLLRVLLRLEPLDALQICLVQQVRTWSNVQRSSMFSIGQSCVNLRLNTANGWIQVGVSDRKVVW